MRLIYLLIIPLFLIGCEVKEPDKVKEVIRKAGKNRSELQKVINHYKQIKEKQKLKAAYFLIANMEDKYGIYFPEDAYYYIILSKVDSLKTIDGCSDIVNKTIEKNWNDFIQSEENQIHHKKIADIHIISSDFLIDNIDLAFLVWKEKPWAKHLNFNQFCEWILPYRVYDEPLQPWRRMMYKELSWVEDSIKSPENLQDVCLLVNDFIANGFQFSHKLGIVPMLGGVDAWKNKSGICEHRYQLITMAMRSIGIPVSIDYTFQFVKGAGSHQWTVLLDSDGKTKSFNGGEPIIKLFYPAICPIDINYEVLVTNIFRKQYAINKESAGIKLKAGLVPPIYDNKYIKNVITEYDNSHRQELELELKNHRNEEYAWLYCFGKGQNVIPVSYSKIKNNKASFKNICRGGIYFVGYSNQKGIRVDDLAFSLSEIGEGLNYMKPKINDRQKIKLYRKYPVKYDMQPFVDGMLGAKIEGSNNSDFNGSETIYEIKKQNTSLKKISLETKKSYRYYRYISSNSADIHLSELVLFNNNSNSVEVKVSGDVYGLIPHMDECFDGIFDNAFDNSIKTNFNAPKGSWVAIDAGEPTKLTSIKLIARNHLNIVEPGDTYELMLFDKNWNSIATTVANDYFVEFGNVPAGSLLLLRNLTKGSEERIFIFENNKQVWQ